MIVRLRLDVSDEQRRTVRKRMGRGGLATRKDIEAWAVAHVMGDLVAAERPAQASPAPEPPRRVSRALSSLDAAIAAANDAACKHCGKTKDQHGKLGYTCLGRQTRFEAA